ncbi:MAG: glycosyltransferase family 4 protein, partial [Thermoleophilaceae bacterium]
MPIPVLYIAPWVDHGGTDKATADWFRSLDRERFTPSLVTTQPSSNRRLADVVPLADEIWPLPDLMAGKDFPSLILDLIHSRGIRVVHVMNSRLAFDLLPAIASLPSPPAVVVQLHVEEDDRSGFVRYVTTRYGNLVDAFSIVSAHLTDVVVGEYEIPRFKCHTMHLGVDAEEEFSPGRVSPVREVEPGPFNVLYPVRLVRQKDPLTMVAAAAALRDTGVDFRVHVVGEGELEPQVREAVASAGLEDRVLFHGSRADMPGWFAACDAVLLTSVFEGVPVVVYEAMAMAKPLVSPRLAPIAEVVDDDCATLVEPGSDGAAYADALTQLARDPGLRDRKGAAARARATEHFTLERTARAHEQLYEQIAPP